MEWLLDPIYYNWIIIAVLLFIFELTTYTLLALWFALAAVVMAVLTYFFPAMDTAYQLYIFAGLSVVATTIWYTLFRKPKVGEGDASMNNRTLRYVGKKATLSQAIVHGVGKVQIEGIRWRVECQEDLPIGSTVLVTQAKGMTLLVEAVK